MEIRGTLIPIGGNEDKGADFAESAIDFQTDGILHHIVREAGGPDANIVVIPTASSIPKVVAQGYMNGFGMLGCRNVRVLNIRSKRDSEQEAAKSMLAQADAVMFSGGDQSKIARRIGGTSLHQILIDRYHKDNFVIAGTSAGAMAMSAEMVAGGSSRESLYKGAVKMKQGLGLIPELIIDTHFTKRGRFGRLGEALAIHPGLMGLGLAEDTGVIIKQGRHAKVIGSGMVILFDPSEVSHNNHANLPEATPMSLGRLIVHILAENDSFQLDTRSIQVSPLTARRKPHPVKL